MLCSRLKRFSCLVVCFVHNRNVLRRRSRALVSSCHRPSLSCGMSCAEGRLGTSPPGGICRFGSAIFWPGWGVSGSGAWMGIVLGMACDLPPLNRRGSRRESSLLGPGSVGGKCSLSRRGRCSNGIGGALWEEWECENGEEWEIEEFRGEKADLSAFEWLKE